MQPLTSWEKQLLEFRAAGTPIKQIAKQYKLDPRSVINKLNHAYAKAGLVFSPSDDRLWRLDKIREFVKTLSTGTEDTTG